MTSAAKAAVPVRAYQAGDRDAVRALLTRTFGTPEIFDRYETGNPLGDFLAVVAVHDGVVVGFNMWNAWLLHTAAGPATIYQSGCTAVDASMRGRGVFASFIRAGEAAARDRRIGVLIGFPNPSSFKAFVTAKWDCSQRLGLFVSPVPAVGRPHHGAESRATAPTDSTAARFIAWRYERAGISGSRATLRDGRHVTVYARSQRRMGLCVNKLLDVVDDDGRRVTNSLGFLPSMLPGPGISFLRAIRAPSDRPPWIHVPRKWETPLVIKRVTPGEGPDDATIRNACYWYGDIDAT